MGSIENDIKNYFLDSYKKGKEIYWTSVTEKNTLLKQFIKIIKKTNKKAKLLDIGCGIGKHAILASKEGMEVHGIDISPIAIKKAKENAKKQKAKAFFKVNNVLNIKYPEGYFDAVYDFSCFTHIPRKDWDNYFKQISKILKPGGYFLLSVWSKNSGPIPEVNFNPQTSKRNWNITKQKGLKGKLYTFYFTKRDLVRLLKQHKFNVFLIKEIFLHSYTKFMPGSKLKLWFAFCKKE